MFFPLTIEYLGAYINKEMIFFINVLTWHGQQKALMALLWWFYMLCINKECKKKNASRFY